MFTIPFDLDLGDAGFKKVVVVGSVRYAAGYPRVQIHSVQGVIGAKPIEFKDELSASCLADIEDALEEKHRKVSEAYAVHPEDFPRDLEGA